VRDAYPLAGLYFVVFLLVGTYLILNLFVGVIIENFQQQKDVRDGLDMLTEDQRAWLGTRSVLFAVVILRVSAAALVGLASP